MTTDVEIEELKRQAVRDFAEKLIEYAKKYEKVDYYDGMNSSDIEDALEAYLEEYDK